MHIPLPQGTYMPRLAKSVRFQFILQLMYYVLSILFGTVTYATNCRCVSVLCELYDI